VATLGTVRISEGASERVAEAEVATAAAASERTAALQGTPGITAAAAAAAAAERVGL
jgi:hypothetical protein